MEEIAGGHGRAVALGAGERIRIVNTHGTQVVDSWALARQEVGEYLSVEQTRRMLFRLFPRQGDQLFSNRRNPMLLIEEDSSPGHHDMLLACCDPWLYQHYGCPPGHRNCRDNFREALLAEGFEWVLVPNPLNLWMNIPVTGNDAIAIAPPLSRPGDHVLFRALVDLVLVLSACPMDVTPINGEDRTPRPVHFERLPRT
ncbi:MAG: urea carboxylase-associated family protein [Dongiaceae bacterium]